MHCDALNATVTEIRIHGCDVYDSHIKAAGCVVEFDVVYLQSVIRTRSDCRAWPVLSGLLANGSSSFQHRKRVPALGTGLSQRALLVKRSRTSPPNATGVIGEHRPSIRAAP